MAFTTFSRNLRDRIQCPFLYLDEFVERSQLPQVLILCYFFRPSNTYRAEVRYIPTC